MSVGRISDEQLIANFKLIADLYVLVEEREAERDAIQAKNDDLQAVIAERDKTITELHDHIADLERPAPRKRAR